MFQVKKPNMAVFNSSHSPSFLTNFNLIFSLEQVGQDKYFQRYIPLIKRQKSLIYTCLSAGREVTEFLGRGHYER